MNFLLFGDEENSAILNDSNEICFSYNAETGTWQSSNLFITRMNHDGELITNSEVDYRTGSQWAYYAPRCMVQSVDGNYVLGGFQRDSSDIINQIPNVAATVKVTPEGEVLWRQKYMNATRHVYEVARASDGGYWLAASRVTGTFSFGVEYPTNAVIIKTDSLGQELWRHEFGGYGHDEITGIIEEPDRLVVAGFQTYDEPVWDINQSESMLNGYVFARSYSVGPNSLSLVSELRVFECQGQTNPLRRELPIGFKIAASSGEFFLWGHGAYSFGPVGHGFLCKMDFNLDTLWFRRYLHPLFLPGLVAEGGGAHQINDIAEAPDGSIYMVGHVWGYNPPEYPWNIERLWLLHVDEHGCLEPGCHLVGTEEIITHMTQTMRVYPNPARDNCTIAFSLIDGYTAPAQSQLKLTDMQGRIVRTIALSGAEVAGGKVRVDLSGLAPGVYVAHWMDGGRWMDSVKIVVE